METFQQLFPDADPTLRRPQELTIRYQGVPELEEVARAVLLSACEQWGRVLGPMRVRTVTTEDINQNLFNGYRRLLRAELKDAALLASGKGDELKLTRKMRQERQGILSHIEGSLSDLAKGRSLCRVEPHYEAGDFPWGAKRPYWIEVEFSPNVLRRILTCHDAEKKQRMISGLGEKFLSFGTSRGIELQ